jgi:hypothetical protein
MSTTERGTSVAVCRDFGGLETLSDYWRRGRPLVVVLIALICAIMLAGCGPLPTVTVGSPGVAFEGGSCTLVVNATGLTPNTTWGIGMYTTGSPVVLGDLTSDSSGSINNGTVTYPSTTLPKKYSNLYVEVYTVNGGQLGSGIASSQVTTEVCLPSGLRP